jgi:hypothetical protein
MLRLGNDCVLAADIYSPFTERYVNQRLYDLVRPSSNILLVPFAGQYTRPSSCVVYSLGKSKALFPFSLLSFQQSNDYWAVEIFKKGNQKIRVISEFYLDSFILKCF